ncbi:hypothetical protein Tco_0861155 [Tanacetum coccineum]|uniref:Xylulose kinase-1 n=1 Tax=Tanacetum coccineum TaxID=301880 RepID=A0ABQ5BK05_9ASTR
MVACLERIDRNADFHEIVDFLTASPIHYALTISPTIYASYIEQFWNTVHSQPISDVKQIHATIDGKTILISELLVRSDLHFNDEDGITCLTNDAYLDNLCIDGQAFQEDTQLPQTSVPIPNVADEDVFKEWDDRVVRATTTSASLDAAHASGVNTPESDEERIKHQKLTDNIPPTPYDSPLSGGYTPGSDKGRPDLNELMNICTKLSDRKRIKKLERKAKSSILSLKKRLYKHFDSSDDSLGEANASKQGRNDSNKTEELNLSDKGSGGTKVFNNTTAAEKDVNATEPVSIAGDVITTASVIPDVGTAGPPNVSTAGPSISTAGDIFEDEMTTIADTLVAIRSTRPRTTSVVIRNVEEEPRRATPIPIV